jgi:hypothetical protein
MGDLPSAISAANRAVVKGTSDKQLCAWDRFNTKSLVHSLSSSEKVDLVLNHPSFSNLNPSVPPWTAWYRPTNWLTNQTQGWTVMESLFSFYNVYCGDTNQQTLENYLK